MATIPGRPASLGWDAYVANRFGRHSVYGYGNRPNGGVGVSAGSGSHGNGGIGDKARSALFKAVDIAMQPTYALTELAMELDSGDKPDSWQDWTHLGSGNSKVSWSDLFMGRGREKYQAANKYDESANLVAIDREGYLKNAPGWVQTPVGFAADVAFDPLTYTGAGLIAKGVGLGLKGAGKVAVKEAAKGLTDTTAQKIAGSQYLKNVSEHGVIGERVNAGRAAVGGKMRDRKAAALTAAGQDITAPLRSAAQDKAAEKTLADRLYGDIQRVQNRVSGNTDALYPRLGRAIDANGNVSTKPVGKVKGSGLSTQAGQPATVNGAPGRGSAAPVAPSAVAASGHIAEQRSQQAAVKAETVKQEVQAKTFADQLAETQQEIAKKAEQPVIERTKEQQAAWDAMAAGHSINKVPVVREGINGLLLKDAAYESIDHATGKITKHKTVESAQKAMERALTRDTNGIFDWADEFYPPAVKFREQSARSMAAQTPVVARDPKTGAAVKATNKAQKGFRGKTRTESYDYTDDLVEQLKDGFVTSDKVKTTTHAAEYDVKALKDDPELNLQSVLDTVFEGKGGAAQIKNIRDVAGLGLEVRRALNALDSKDLSNAAALMVAHLKGDALKDLAPAVLKALDPTAQGADLGAAVQALARHLAGKNAGKTQVEYVAKQLLNEVPLVDGARSKAAMQAVLKKQFDAINKGLDKRLNKALPALRKRTSVETITGWFAKDESAWRAKWENILDPEHIDALLNAGSYDEFETYAKKLAGAKRKDFDPTLGGSQPSKAKAMQDLKILVQMAYLQGEKNISLSWDAGGTIESLDTTLDYGIREQVQNASDDVLKALDSAEPRNNITEPIKASEDAQHELKLVAENDAYRHAAQEKNEWYRQGREIDPNDPLWNDIAEATARQLDPNYTMHTDRTNAARDSVIRGIGSARHQNTWNLHAQVNLASVTAARHSKDFDALYPYPVKDSFVDAKEYSKALQKYSKAKAEYMLAHLIPDLEKVDRYMLAQGMHLHPHLSSTYEGAPLGLGQVLRIMADWPEKGATGIDGRQRLLSFIMAPWNPSKGISHRNPGERPTIIKKSGERRQGANFVVGMQQLAEIANNVANVARNVMPDGTLNKEGLEAVTEAWQAMNRMKFRNMEELGNLKPGDAPIQQSLFRVGRDSEGAVKEVRGLANNHSGRAFNPNDVFDAPQYTYDEVQWMFEHPYFVAAITDRVIKNATNLNANFAIKVGAKSGDLLKKVAQGQNRLAPLHELTDAYEVPERMVETGLRYFDDVYSGPLGLGANPHPHSAAGKKKVKPNQGKDDPTDMAQPHDPAEDMAAGKIAIQEAQADLATRPVDAVSIGAARAQGGKTAQVRPVTAKGLNSQAHVAQQQSNLVAAAAKAQSGVVDPGEVIEIGMNTRIFDIIDKGLRHLNKSYGDATIHAAAQVAGNLGSVLSRTFRHDLNDFHRASVEAAQAAGLTSTDYVRNLFKNIQTGTAGATAVETQLQRRLEELTNQIFSSHPDSLLGVWAREGMDPEYLNEMLQRGAMKDLNIEIDLNKFGTKRKVTTYSKKGNAKTEKIQTLKDLDQVWRTWKIDDPLDFLAKMQKMTVDAATHIGTAREFHNLAVDAGLLTMKPRTGWIKVTRKTAYDSMVNGKSIKSTITRHMPMNGQGEVFMHPDLFAQMKRADEMIAHLENDAIARNNLGRMYDQVIAIFKSGMTIWRPAHHVRTVIGDVTLTHFASGLKNPEYFYKALRVSQAIKGQRDLAMSSLASAKAKERAAKANFRGSFGSWDALAALNGLREGIDKMPKGFQTAVKGTLKHDTVSDPITFIKDAAGNKRELAPGEVSRLAMLNGILPDFNLQEDIVQLSNKGFKANPLIQMHRKNREKLGNFVEGRDDFVRMAHFMHLLENGINNKGWAKGMSFDDIAKAAAAQVRKVHPDGSDLTPFERKYMRRIFTFYSWTRKAIPLVVENTLKHPGRAMAFPKAMYNWGNGVAGLDLQSMSDPFPDDEMFPEFVTDPMTGFAARTKDGQYYTFSLGLSNVDIYNDWFAGGQGGGDYDKPGPVDDILDLGKGFAMSALQMGTPLVQLPYGLLTGTQFGGSIKTPDKGEVLEGSLPVLGDIARISGYSPLGSAETLAKGKGLDPLRQAEKDNRGAIGGEPGWSPEYLTNYLTGIRLTNVSKPSYQNVAEIEKRDRAAAIKRDQE